VAKTKQVGFELAGDVSGGDEETYVFDFTVNKQQKRIPEPDEIN
jgi:hypothetical protein